MLTWLANLLTGGTVGKLVDAYAKAKDAGTEQERIRADLAGKQLDNRLALQRLAQEVRLATAGFWEMRLLTFLTALPFVLHAGMVGIDTTFRLGLKIPPYPAPFDAWEGTILLSFFGVGLAGTGIKAVSATILARRS